MQIFCALCGLFLAIAIVNSSPVVKRETEEDINPLNEVYVLEVDDGNEADGERGDRDKRKIGLSLGVTNGIINFVFGKLDSFLDSKTRALTALDDSNRAKNAAFGIDPNQSATSQFISNYVSQKLQATTGSIGPIINSATTLLSGASAGFSNALASKIAPLSSLSGGLSGGGGAGTSITGSSTGTAQAVKTDSNILGSFLTQGLGSLSSLSQSSGGDSTSGSGTSGSGTSGSGTSGSGASTGSNGGAGFGASNGAGAFANLAGVGTRPPPTTTTEDDTVIFDRTKVSLDIPSGAFGTGFTVITNISKILNSLILNSARRTQTLLEIFKPFFRGTFAIKGLPSDNPK